MEEASSSPPAETPDPGPETPKPTADQRRAEINRKQKVRRRKGFIIGLLVGQILILGLNFGGELILKLLEGRVEMNAPYSLRAVVFLGMTAGIVFTAVLIFFILGLQGAAWTFGRKKVGFFTAVGRGMKRCFKAAWAVGLTLGVIGGTGWLMISAEEQGQMIDDGTEFVGDQVDRAKTKINEWLSPPPDEEPSE